MLRAQVREEVFKIIFRIPFNNMEEMKEQLDYSMEELENKSEENQNYIRNKVSSILDHVQKIDTIIEDNCEGWNITRIGKAEIAILRIAVYEMLFEEDIPCNVAINEAVELSKTYCNEDTKRFINAVLGKVSKSLV